MQFLYISTLKNQVYPPKEKKSHAAQLFQNFFFPFLEFIFLFGIFSVFFSTLLNVKLNFDELLRTMCNIFPPFFKNAKSRIFSAF